MLALRNRLAMDFELGHGASEGTLQFVQGRVVPAVAVMFQEKRSAAKYADQNLRWFVNMHSRTCFCSKPRLGAGEKLSRIAQFMGVSLIAA